ncbi:Cytochrome P450 78A5 [Linum perenne]
MGSLAHRNLAVVAARTGSTRLMAFSLGTVPVIISSHPDTAREILSGPAFSDRPVKISARLLMFERAIGFAPSEGTYWRQLRRIASTHMFSPRKVSELEPVRQRVIREMIDRVRNEMTVTNQVVLREVLQKGSLDNVLESVFGGGLEDVREELGLMVKEGFELIAKFNFEDYFPMVRFLDIYGVKRRCFKLASKVNEVVGRVVAKRKKVMGCGSTIRGRRNVDFLSALLCLPEQERLQESDMVPILWEMVFRGTDTVAILLEWTMARMTLHPEIQTKAQQEIDDMVGRDVQVRDSDVQNLPYLQAIVKETLRLHPPGPLLSWARLAIHDVHVDKTLIPRGTTAMVNMWAITHDPSIWDDPWEFKPERFLEEDVSVMGSDLRLAPFGSGRRVCPGKALGLATVQLWLARFLQRFDWLPAQPVDLSERLGMAMEMKRPLICYAVERRSK